MEEDITLLPPPPRKEKASIEASGDLLLPPPPPKKPIEDIEISGPQPTITETPQLATGQATTTVSGVAAPKITKPVIATGVKTTLDYFKDRTKEKILKEDNFNPEKNPNAQSYTDSYFNSLSKQGYSQSQIDDLKSWSKAIVGARDSIVPLDARIKKNPLDKEAYYLKGLVYTKLGDPNEAIKSFEKSAEIPDVDQGVPTQESAGRLAKAPVTNGDNFYGMGYAFQKAGKDENAITNYQMAIDDNPEHNKLATQNAYTALADILWKRGDKEGSKQLSQAAASVAAKIHEENAIGVQNQIYDEDAKKQQQQRDDVVALSDFLIGGQLSKEQVQNLGPGGQIAARLLSPAYNVTDYYDKLKSSFTEGASDIKESIVNTQNGKDATTENIRALNGLTKIGFGVVSALNPATITAFNVGTEVAEATLPEDISKLVLSAPSAIMDAYTTPDQQTELQKQLKQAADVIWQLGTLHLAAKGLKKEGEIIKEKAKDNTPLTGEETTQVLDAIKTATPEDINNAIKTVVGEIQKQEIVNTSDTHKALLAEQNKLQTALDNPAIPEEVKNTTIADNLNKVNEQISKSNDEFAKTHEQELAKQNEVTVLEDKIKSHEEAIKAEPSLAESFTPLIEGWKAEKDNLTKTIENEKTKIEGEAKKQAEIQKEEPVLNQAAETAPSVEQPPIETNVEIADNLKTQKHETGTELERQLPNTLSQSEKQGVLRGGEINAEATILTRAVHSAVKASKSRSGEVLRQIDVRNQEEKSLEDYAKNKGVWKEDKFGEPDSGGFEQDVYYSEDGKVATKVNSNILHDTWGDFFDRIALHNKLFPDAAYTLKGFTEHNGEFSAIIEQPFIKKGTKPVEFSEIKSEMEKLGFENVESSNPLKKSYEFVNNDLGVIVKDLHGENVIKGEDGKIHFIDPVIEFTPERKQANNNLKPEENAIKTGEIQEGDQLQYSGVNEVGKAAEAGNSNQPIEGGEIQKAQEVIVPEEKLSGIKKELVPALKIEGTPIEKRSTEDVFNKGKELVDNGDINPKAIIDEINTKPRALQPDEVASLVYYKAKLDKSFDTLIDGIEKAKVDGDINQEALLRTQLEGLNKDLDAYHDMSLKTAYEQSLAFRLRQMLVDSEYNLKTQERKYKEINKGEIPPDVAERFKQYDEQLKDVNKRIRDLEKLREEDAGKSVDVNAEKEAELNVREERKKNRTVAKEKIQGERKQIVSDIKEKLRQARTGQSGLTAVPIPYAKELAIIAPDVAKLMRNYAQEGIVTLDQFVDNIHNDIKDLIDGITKDDVRDIIAGNYKEPKKRSEINNALNDARREAKLITRLEKLLEGENIEKPEKQRRIDREEIAKLKKEIGEHNTTRLGQLKSRYETDIKKYEDKLAKGDFEKPLEKQPPVYDKEMKQLEIERNAIKEKFDVEQEKARLENRPLSQKVSDNFIDALNLPKSLMASADLSAPLRQGIVLSAMHPVLASKAFAEMFRHAFSEKKATQWLNEVRHSDIYRDIKKSELYLSEPTAKLTAKEEQFVSNIAKKIPGLGKIIAGSERAYTGYLNKLRVDTFSQFHDALVKEGFKGEELNKELKSFAEFVNNASGRGKLGKFEEAAPLLNALFFSPRYVVSRFNLLNPATYVGMTKQARIEALKTMGTYLGIGSMVLAMAKASGAEVEDDPRSADFGKIKVGNTRYDMWAGFQQQVRLISQLATGEKKAANGQIKELGKGFNSETRLDVTGRFIRSKLGPTAGVAADVLAGKDYAGNPITVSDEVIKNIVPLWTSDIKDLYKEQGVVGGTASSLASFFGIGVQQYNPNKKAENAKAAYKQKYQ